jgi:hypothetical protein
VIGSDMFKKGAGHVPIRPPVASASVMTSLYQTGVYAEAIVLKNLGCNMPLFKAVDRGDKRTRRLRVRVLALRENPRRDRLLDPALRENPLRERVLAGSRLETRQWKSSSSFHGLSMERGQECPLMGGWSLKPWI